MRNIVKILDNVNSVNSFDEVEEITLIRGNSYELNFRLMTSKYVSGGEQVLTRYIPQGSSVTVEVQFDNLDLNYHIKRTAQTPFPGDGSIRMVPLLPQDQLMFNSMRVVVNEDGKKTTFLVETDIATEEVGDRRRFT